MVVATYLLARSAKATAIIGDATWMAFFVCLIPLGYVLGVVAITAKGRHVNRTEAWYFQSWLADWLQTPDAAVIAYRPGRGIRRAEGSPLPASLAAMFVRRAPLADLDRPAASMVPLEPMPFR